MQAVVIDGRGDAGRRVPPESAVDQGERHLRGWHGLDLLCQWGGVWTGTDYSSVINEQGPELAIALSMWKLSIFMESND